MPGYAHAQHLRAIHPLGYVLHAMHAAYLREPQRMRVTVNETKRARRVREAGRRPVLGLESGEADPAPLPQSLARLRPVRQRVRQRLKTSVVRLLTVLPPPRFARHGVDGERALGLIPPPAQRVVRPFRLLLSFKHVLDVRQSRVVREPRRTGMGLQESFLPWRRVERHPDRLKHHAPPSTPRPSYAWRHDARTVVRRTRSAPRSCRAPSRRPAPCRPPR